VDWYHTFAASLAPLFCNSKFISFVINHHQLLFGLAVMRAELANEKAVDKHTRHIKRDEKEPTFIFSDVVKYI